MLTGTEILNQIHKGEINISDFNEKRLNPNSYNLRLRPELIVYSNDIIDSKKENSTNTIPITESGLVLFPNTLYLGSTIETTHTNKFIPCISGRSSIGRLGINIHATAGFGDIGFNGTWTLEIFCVQPVIIYPEMEICQIYFFNPNGEDSEDPIIKYKGKYQDQIHPGYSKLYKDYEVINNEKE